MHGACFVEGRPVSLAEATRAAANLIEAARLPLFLLGACDVAGARAAIKLAAQAGGVIDHVDSAHALRELDVTRSFGKFIITPHEARERADTILVVGSGLTSLWPEVVEVLGLADVPRLALHPQPRRILWIGAGDEDEALSRLAGQAIGVDQAALAGVIAVLRARTAGRHAAFAGVERERLDAIADNLRQAQFGLVIYAPSALDALVIEMLAGLVADLNKTTRFSTISIGGTGQAETVMQTAAWMTGFPIRTGFARSYPEHDPWRFDAARLIDTGETDALLWISADAAALPAWTSRPPSIAISRTRAEGAKISIEIGQHGRDHESVEFARAVQALTWKRASHPSDVASAALVLHGIAAALHREAA